MTNITLLQIHKEFEGNISWADKLGRISMLTVQVVEVGPFSLKARIYIYTVSTVSEQRKLANKTNGFSELLDQYSTAKRTIFDQQSSTSPDMGSGSLTVGSLETRPRRSNRDGPFEMCAEDFFATTKAYKSKRSSEMEYRRTMNCFDCCHCL